jgi:hypothetical protein
MQCTRSLKPPGFNPCAYQVISWFQNLLFQMRRVWRYAEMDAMRLAHARDTALMRAEIDSSRQLHAAEALTTQSELDGLREVGAVQRECH